MLQACTARTACSICAFTPNHHNQSNCKENKCAVKSCIPGAKVLEQAALRGVCLDARRGQQDADVLVSGGNQAGPQLVGTQLVQQRKVKCVKIRLLRTASEESIPTGVYICRRR